jgi:hypothetical protein
VHAQGGQVVIADRVWDKWGGRVVLDKIQTAVIRIMDDADYIRRLIRIGWKWDDTVDFRDWLERA